MNENPWSQQVLIGVMLLALTCNGPRQWAAKQHVSPGTPAISTAAMIVAGGVYGAHLME